MTIAHRLTGQCQGHGSGYCGRSDLDREQFFELVIVVAVAAAALCNILFSCLCIVLFSMMKSSRCCLAGYCRWRRVYIAQLQMFSSTQFGRLRTVANFHAHDATLARYMAWPCVCVPDARRCCIKAVKHRIRQTTPHDNVRTTVFCCQRSW